MSLQQDSFMFIVKYEGTDYEFSVPSLDSLVQELGLLIEDRLNVALTTQKLLGPRLKGALKLGEYDGSLKESGLECGKRYLLVGSRKTDLTEVQEAKEEPRIRNFDEELQREEAKRRPSSFILSKPSTDGYAFQNFQVLRQASLHPSPEAAERLLYRLASDPGIIGILQKHKWKVGLLSEMPPEGKVGVSKVCVLGCNVNKGQEISLRLRTDDLKGFRKYLSIRQTLLHELAHMVWSEHDANFRKLNSQLVRECEQFIRESGGGFTLTGEPTAPEDNYQDLPHSDGQVVGGNTASLSPMEAAKQAAIRRAATKSNPSDSNTRT